MKKVIQEHISLNESMKALLPIVDFTDTFSTKNHIDSLEQIAKTVFKSDSKLVAVLFSIRNKIVGLFGLKTELPDDHNEEFRVGSYISFFKIYSIAENELVLGANDSHLNFRAVLQRHNEDLYNIKMTTLVEYNNMLGKIYMNVIKPFHKLLLMRMLKNVFEDSEIT